LLTYFASCLHIASDNAALPSNRRHTMAVEALKTNDLFQTSSGVGHHWRPGYYFPSNRHGVRLRASLNTCMHKHVTTTEIRTTRFKSSVSMFLPAICESAQFAKCASRFG